MVQRIRNSLIGNIDCSRLYLVFGAVMREAASAIGCCEFYHVCPMLLAGAEAPAEPYQAFAMLQMTPMEKGA